ncbi:MAG: ROK family protein [Nitrospinota bacterium]|nr:MAG: ROK family protein [Nitrospinota bacterium]
MEPCVIGVDMGGTNTRTAAITRQGEIVARQEHPTAVEEGREQVVANLVAAIHDLCQTVRKEQREVVAIGIGVAGAIKIKEGIVSESPNLPGWTDFPLRQILTDHLSLPIIIENDANAAALGEYWAGAGRQVENLVCITLGTGVGGGIILEGNIWHGVDGTAGEVGHITLEPQGALCKCGNRGCLEAYASATALTRMAREAMERGEETLLRTLCQDNAAALSAEMVSQAAQQADRVAQRILERMGRYLGIAIANLANLLNIEMVVVGGKVSQAWDLFIPFTEEEIRQRAFAVPADRCRVVKAERGDDAGLLGAAYMAWKSFPLSSSPSPA